MKNYKLDFPILAQTSHGKPLVYLDNANTSQKPHCVIQAMTDFYQHDYSNIHRGVYQLSERATNAFEGVREKVREFINARATHEIIFTSGTTDGINLVAQSYGRSFVAGDEVIISVMEHHSNIVPWQLLRDQIGIVLKIIPITNAGEIDQDAYKKLFSSRTKLLAITHASNVLGTINPIKEMAAIAHAHNVPVLVDGAQAVAHMPVDVQDLDCDFYVFSSHKAYGPSGVGVLYGKAKLLDKMPPYQGGGSMIEQVTFEKTTYATLPTKFEAGTPNIAGVIGFGAAIDYLRQIGLQQIVTHEQDVLAYAIEQLSKVPGLQMIGTSKEKVAVITFVLAGVHPHDIGTILDREGVAVRAGHHCAMPLMQHYQVPATIRASFGLYNNKDDVDALLVGIQAVTTLFA